MPLCPICSWSPDDPKYLLVSESNYWRIILAPNQSLPGRCVLHLKRHCNDLADITADELLDWLALVKLLESALKIAFDATLSNWSCYMNESYREDSPDPHVHWWAVPRYNHLVRIDSWIFEDPHFGRPYDHQRWVEVPPEIHLQIARRIQQAIENCRQEIRCG